MTAAEAIALLAKLPADTPLCFCVDDDAGTFAEVTQFEMVPVTSDGEYFAATFDGAAEGAIKVAVAT
jgi:hypothetical protein